MVEAVQVNCPFCHAANAAAADGHYHCDFCLQPFSVVEAQQEESRLLREVKQWVQERVGTVGMPSSIDAASRSFIFRQRILPDLKRDVDRALESIGSYADSPLLAAPVPMRPANRSHALATSRAGILGLKDLRARLSSDQIREFALTDADKEQVTQMDMRMGGILHLSNVTDAAARRDSVGYTSARRNLESLSQDVGRALATSNGDRAGFLGGLQTRYRGLAEICDVFARLCDPATTIAEDDAERLERTADDLAKAAHQIDASNHSPAESMPFVIAIQDEARACRETSRWVGAYTLLGSGVPFATFVEQMSAAVGGATACEIDRIEVIVRALSVASRQAASGVVGDTTWMRSWAEGQRAKKTFGLLGSEEEIAAMREFFLPVWCADMTYSKAAGAVFKSGVEGRALLAVPACSPRVADVIVIEGRDHAIPRALASPTLLAAEDVALPTATWEDARRVFLEAIGRRQEFMNPQLRPNAMVFVPAAQVTFRSKKGQRHSAAWLDGTLSIDAQAAASARRASSVITALAMHGAIGT